MKNRNAMTWGDAFAEVEELCQPNEDRAALAAAHFADLLEVVNAQRGVSGLRALEDFAEAA